MTALLRPGSLAAAAVLLAAACTCSRNTATSAGSGDTGHVILDAAGGASNANDAAGGTSSGVGGGSGTTGAAAGGAYTGPTGLLPCASLPPSSEPVPDGWPVGAKRLPALDPDVYVFEVPPDPTPLTWKACGTGCLKLVNTWAPTLSEPLYVNTKGGMVGGSSPAWLNGIGIGKASSGYCVQVNVTALSDEVRRALPGRVEGVEVRVEVVAQIARIKHG